MSDDEAKRMSHMVFRNVQAIRGMLAVLPAGEAAAYGRLLREAAEATDVLAGALKLRLRPVKGGAR